MCRCHRRLAVRVEASTVIRIANAAGDGVTEKSREPSGMRVLASLIERARSSAYGVADVGCDRGLVATESGREGMCSSRFV
jgi:hypothetical protein